jgi:DNA/RNA endonuclease YhcR with UshA esterase domain
MENRLRINKYFLIIIFLCFAVLSGCSKKDDEIKVKKQSDTSSKVKQQETQVPEKDEPPENTDNNTVQKTPPVKTEVKRITTFDLRSSIGKKVILVAYVADVTVREKVAYLNLDAKYPKNTGSITIFAANFDEFGDMQKYKNKNIEVNGYVSEYQNRPQIIINSPNQIKILK